MTSRTRTAGLGALIASTLLLTACGSQVSHERLLVGAGGTAGGDPISATNGQTTTTGSGGTTTGTTTGLPGSGATGASSGTSGSSSGSTSSTGTSSTGAGTSGTSGTGSGTTTGAPAQAGAPIVIGQIGEFSGIAGQAQGPAQVGLQAWVKTVNARGGISGHPVKLLVRDDGGDSAKAASQAKELVEQDHAVAIVGAFVALTFNGLKSYTQPRGIPVVGGDLSDVGWNTNTNFFPQGATQSNLNLGFVRTAVEAGNKKIAFFYCVELPACSASNTALQNGGAKSQGGELVYSTQVSVTTLNFQSQCTNAKNAGAQAIYIIGDAGMTSRMGRDCRQVGFTGQFLAPGIGTSSAQQTDPNLQGLIALAYNFPYVANDLPAVKEYQQALARYAPGVETNGSTSQAWAAGQLLAEAVAKIPSGKQVTPAAIIEGLHAVSGTTLAGLAPKLSFPKSQPAGKTKCYFVTAIRSSKWWAPQGSRLSCIV